MPKLKNYGAGKRVNIWVPERHLKLWTDLENNSAFVQLCLDNAIDIMTWAILKKERPDLYKGTGDGKTVEEVVPQFNKYYPLDPLTAKRLGKETWPQSSVKQQEKW